MAVQNIDFIDEKERELFGAAVLGERIRAFLMNDQVGQYLHHRAKTQIQQSDADAARVDLYGIRGWLYAKRRLRAIRQRREVAQAFISWLAEAINDGNNAAAELEDYQKT